MRYMFNNFHSVKTVQRKIIEYYDLLCKILIQSKGMASSNQKSKKITKPSPSVDLTDRSPEIPDRKTGNGFRFLGQLTDILRNVFIILTDGFYHACYCIYNNFLHLPLLSLPFSQFPSFLLTRS